MSKFYSEWESIQPVPDSSKKFENVLVSERPGTGYLITNQIIISKQKFFVGYVRRFDHRSCMVQGLIRKRGKKIIKSRGQHGRIIRGQHRLCENSMNYPRHQISFILGQCVLVMAQLDFSKTLSIVRRTHLRER